MGISSTLLAKKAVDDMLEMAYDVSRGKPDASDGAILCVLFNPDKLVAHATDYLANELVEDFGLSIDAAKSIIATDEWQSEIQARAIAKVRDFKNAVECHFTMPVRK